ncbi:hypothetical protein GDO78_022713 [Eleutherodactylus coqui]|uniref:Uncharacterized protein n=1 Tax=Eleutherodactylus coqui TaxID=57060 RepID=A0A8J6JYB9_ELECQ|nr:hypothetical protein GDO78_022713 [Eleutherodactylus coqui]
MLQYMCAAMGLIGGLLYRMGGIDLRCSTVMDITDDFPAEEKNGSTQLSSTVLCVKGKTNERLRKCRDSPSSAVHDCRSSCVWLYIGSRSHTQMYIILRLLGALTIYK